MPVVKPFSVCWFRFVSLGWIMLQGNTAMATTRGMVVAFGVDPTRLVPWVRQQQQQHGHAMVVVGKSISSWSVPWIRKQPQRDLYHNPRRYHGTSRLGQGHGSLQALKATTSHSSIPLHDFYNTTVTTHDDDQEDARRMLHGHVLVLDHDEHWLVIQKPPSVVCHHSEWRGSRQTQEVPILQRVRCAMSNRRVNLVHRLDRGASGCLLLTYAEDLQQQSHHDTDTERGIMEGHPHQHTMDLDRISQYRNSTHALAQALQGPYPDTCKTYVALVRGNGLLPGRNLVQEGWFKVDRPIRDARGVLNNATTWLRFIATGQHLATQWQAQQQQQQQLTTETTTTNNNETSNRHWLTEEPVRASLVLARPETGRWHQIRRHLNGLSHPIVGDTSHGDGRTNRLFRQQLGFPGERVALHLARMQLPSTHPYCPTGVDVTCPLYLDVWTVLQQHLPHLWEQAKPILEQEEGLFLEPTTPTVDQQQQQQKDDSQKHEKRRHWVPFSAPVPTKKRHGGSGGKKQHSR